MSPTKLFARRAPNAVPYPTRAAAFAAVAAGKKALVQHANEPAFVAAARARGFIVMFDDEDNAYAMRDPEEAWRIGAIMFLRGMTRVWTDDAERHMSMLLGYTPAQLDAWLALHREHQAAWGALTVYTLLDRARVRAIDALGRRAFDAPPLDVFVHRTLPIAARPRIPRGLVLARFAIPHDAIALRGRPLARATVDARAINAVLASAITLRTARGWSR